MAGSGNGAIDGVAATLFTPAITARTKGKVLWCVTRQDLFVPARAQAGLLSGRVIYIEASDEKALLACFDEGLQSRRLGAVVAEVARLSTYGILVGASPRPSSPIGSAPWISGPPA